MKSFLDDVDWHRLLLHVPGGLLGAALLWLNGPMGITFNLAFLTYEICQDWESGRRCGFRDILGHVVGLAIGGGAWLILTLLP